MDRQGERDGGGGGGEMKRRLLGVDGRLMSARRISGLGSFES
jgi:hypothetical protein